MITSNPGQGGAGWSKARMLQRRHTFQEFSQSTVNPSGTLGRSAASSTQSDTLRNRFTDMVRTQNMAEAALKDLPEAGSYVWLQDHPQLGLAVGVVERIDMGNNLIVCDDKGATFRIPPSLIQAKVQALQHDLALIEGADDFLELPIAACGEAEVLHCLRSRFSKGKYYTRVGTRMLLAMEPFWSPATVTQSASGPHISHVASSARTSVLSSISAIRGRDVIFTGESGSGKTRAVQAVLKDFCSWSSKASPGNDTLMLEDKAAMTPARLQAASRVLQMFGNAATPSSHNSSRCGCRFQLGLDRFANVKVVGVSAILFDTARAASWRDCESSFHILHSLVASDIHRDAFLKLELAALKLWGADLRPQPIKEEFQLASTFEDLATVGLDSDERDTVLRICSAVVLLGEGAYLEGLAQEVLEDLEAASALLPIKRVADLLMVDAPSLEAALVSASNKSSIQKRMSIASFLYRRLFTWLVGRLGDGLRESAADEVDIGLQGTVSLLDLPGFEGLGSSENSLEQLWINFGAELLQQTFEDHILEFEQQLYIDEEIIWESVEWARNTDLVAALETTSGLLGVVNVECGLPGATSASLLQTMDETFRTSEIVRDILPASRFFVVTHRPGNVKYDCSTFVHKNASLDEAVLNVLLETDSPLVRDILTASNDDSFSPFAALRPWLETCLGDAVKTPLYFVRCLKPSVGLSDNPFVLDSIDLLRQIRCSSLITAIQVCHKGYEEQHSIENFLNRYGPIQTGVQAYVSDEDKVATCTSILQSAEMEIGLTHGDLCSSESKRRQWQVGRSFVFLQPSFRERLDALLFQNTFKTVAVVQARWRGRPARMMRAEAQRCTLQMQSWVRRAKEMREWRRKQHAAVAMQSMLRGVAGVVGFQGVRAATIELQTVMRSHLTRSRFLAQRVLVVCIQRHARGMNCRRRLLKEALHKEELRKDSKMWNLLKHQAARREEDDKVFLEFEKARLALLKEYEMRSSGLQDRLYGRKSQPGSPQRLASGLEQPLIDPNAQVSMPLTGACIRQEQVSVERDLAEIEKDQIQIQADNLKELFLEANMQRQPKGVALQYEMDAQLAEARWMQADLTAVDKQHQAAMNQCGALLEGLGRLKGGLKPGKLQAKDASHSQLRVELQSARKYGEAETQMCQALRSEVQFVQEELTEQRSHTFEILRTRNLLDLRASLKLQAERETGKAHLNDVEDLCLEQADRIRFQVSENRALQEEFSAAKELLVEQVSQIEALRVAQRREENATDAGAEALTALKEQLAAAEEVGRLQALEIAKMRQERSMTTTMKDRGLG